MTVYLCKLKAMLWIRLILVVSCLSLFSEGCTDVLKGTAANDGGTATFQFQPVPTAGDVTYEVAPSTGGAKVRVIYTAGVSNGPASVASSIAFTGNETNGNIAFTFAGISLTDIGVYTLSSSLQDLQCMTLHLLGTFVVQVNANRSSVVSGESVSFTCTPDSQTNPGPDFNYIWIKDSTNLAEDTDTFTISSAQMSDAGTYKCTAIEDITGGQSVTSNGISLTVHGTTTTPTLSTSTSTTTATTSITVATISTPTLAYSTSTTNSASISTTTSTAAIPATSSISVSGSTTKEPTVASTITVTTSSSTTTTPVPSTRSPITTASTITSSADSDKGLVVMIIVVSVIGCVLVIAIFFMMFFMVHWKNCFGQTKHGHLSSYRHNMYRTHQRRERLKHTREISELNSFQKDHVLKEYQFYRGGVKNPVFEEAHVNLSPPLVYYRETSYVS